jgi:hypothetical protein
LGVVAAIYEWQALSFALLGDSGDLTYYYHYPDMSNNNDIRDK